VLRAYIYIYIWKNTSISIKHC